MVPSWLELSNYPPHVENVLTILAQRERARHKARHLSQKKATYPYMPMSSDHSHFSQYYSVSVGAHPDHRRENRYLDFEAYDRTRVVFDASGVVDSSGYINGNWVRELAGGKWWIATQAPLPNTAHTFLGVLLQPMSPPYSTIYGPSPEQRAYTYHPSFPRASRIRTIVQLTRDVEDGMRKAHGYFPDEVGDSYVIPGRTASTTPLRITLEAVRIINEADCIISTVSVVPAVGGRNPIDPIFFNHLLYTAWPDHGIPDEEKREGLIKFARLVDEINRLPSDHSDDPDPPVMVNCSAGIGRTGAFIALSSLLRAQGLLPPTSPPIPTLPLSPLGPLPDEIASDLVAQEVDSCREQRPGAVQRDEQVLLIYHCLHRALSRAPR